ncbi:MAG: hypothetical protein MJ252_09615 [archaeon]|nr:hypothetical protein [archaeon]
MEEERRKAEEERKRLAEEERLRLVDEEEALRGWTEGHEARLTSAYNYILEREDWDKYSNCEEGYLNIRNENELNGFISDFKDKCDSTFISNFKLVERDFNEEMKIFDESQLHYHNLERLRIQGKAALNKELEEYAYKYLRTVYDVEVNKIESLTKYFVENFHLIKERLKKEMEKEEGAKEDECTWEWESPIQTNRLGFWCNNIVANFRNTFTKFKKIDFLIKSIYKSFVTTYSLLRFYWDKYDIREYYSSTDFSPYINIGGCFYVDAIIYPDEPLLKGTWNIRNIIGEGYKNVKGFERGTKNVKQRYSISLPKNIFTKDLDMTKIKIGIYNEEKHEWNTENEIEGIKDNEKRPNIKDVEFGAQELGIFGVLIPRNMNYPYKDWNLRCIQRNGVQIAMLDLESKI